MENTKQMDVMEAPLQLTLSIDDRLYITSSLLPQKDTYSNVLIINDLLKRLDLSDNERKDINFTIRTFPDGRYAMQWGVDNSGNVIAYAHLDKNISFSSSECVFLKQQIERLSNSASIEVKQASLITKLNNYIASITKG